MRESHLQYLICPACASDLSLAEACGTDGIIDCGRIQCIGCRVVYPIVRRIPRFVPRKNYTLGFGFQWNRHRRTQYDADTGAKVSEERFFNETGWDRDLEEQRILEVGGGGGRFTTHAASTGAFVISVDMSDAVEANYESNGHRNNVLIVQADLYEMPLRREFFDKLFCFGVLQHTPNVERAFLSLPQYLTPGGCLVVDVYQRPIWWKHLLTTKYWVRPITRRLPPERLYALVQRYVDTMWPLSRLLHRLPKGKALNWALLIADYREEVALSEERLREWAVLDTFDMLSATYDFPQRIETVREWFGKAGLREVEVGYGYNGIVGRAVRRDSIPS